MHIAKRSLAFIIDYIIGIITLAISISFYGLPNMSDEKSAFRFFVQILLLLFIFLLKDSIRGISIGKWCVGLMIRDANHLDRVPSIQSMVRRNFTALLWFVFEFFKLIFDENNQRFIDKFCETIVVDNPDKAEFKFRVLIAIGILIYFFLDLVDLISA